MAGVPRAYHVVRLSAEQAELALPASAVRELNAARSAYWAREMDYFFEHGEVSPEFRRSAGAIADGIMRSALDDA